MRQANMNLVAQFFGQQPKGKSARGKEWGLTASAEGVGMETGENG